ncbi:hypothetical protein PIB30_009560 [Stylosanthes scabra]|uniref:Uncharacterized protein n=1 Tax=Stylosanthes scabra TaxID=79078 RepID=A0ABU6Q551_9FABA|nr:hypothetical protein [Stylosanthes scabra]
MCGISVVPWLQLPMTLCTGFDIEGIRHMGQLELEFLFHRADIIKCHLSHTFITPPATIVSLFCPASDAALFPPPQEFQDVVRLERSDLRPVELVDTYNCTLSVDE